MSVLFILLSWLSSFSVINFGQTANHANYYNEKFGIHVEFPNRNINEIDYNETKDGFSVEYSMNNQIVILEILIHSTLTNQFKDSIIRHMILDHLGNDIVCEISQFEDQNLLATCSGELFLTYRTMKTGKCMVSAKVFGVKSNKPEIIEIGNGVEVNIWRRKE